MEISERSSRRLVIAICVALAGLRLVIAASVGLGDAEAYYWTWSRSLSLGYLDHGPVVAWMIRASTALFGPTTLGVRALFVVASSSTLWIVALASRRIAASWTAGPIAVGSMLAMPMFLIAGGAANPDVPLILLVALFCLCLLPPEGSPAARAPKLAPIALAGLCAGLATSTKLIGALLVPAVAWAAWHHRRRGRALLSAGMAALAGCAPYLWWNAVRGWPSLRYHLIDRHTRPVGPSLLNLAKLVGGQLGYLSPPVAVLLGAALVFGWRRRRSAAIASLLWVAGPFLVAAYGLILVIPSAEPHWPAAGYVPLVVMLPVALRAWWPRFRAVRGLSYAALAIASVLAIAFHLHVLTDLGVRVMPRSGYEPRYDLANELVGWPRVSDEIAEVIHRRRTTSDRLVVAAGCHYTVCAQLRFAARGRFEVLCPSPRRDQFDFFSGGDGSQRRDLDVLYVRDWRFPFDVRSLYRCAARRPSGSIDIRRGGRIVRRFRLELCEGFGGLATDRWPPPSSPSSHER